VLKECLCPHDGFFFDDELNKQTQGLPPGIFTMVLGSCHSGGMDKRFFETLSSHGSSAEEPVERVRVKTWMPEPAELVKLFGTEEKSTPFKPFGCATIQPRRSTSAGAKKHTGAATKVKQAKSLRKHKSTDCRLLPVKPIRRLRQAPRKPRANQPSHSVCSMHSKSWRMGLPDLIACPLAVCLRP
jgi:hypothetical protein